MNPYKHNRRKTMLTSYTLDKYFDKLMDTYGAVNGWDYTYSGNQYYQTETDTEVTIEMTATGISKGDLKVEVVNNVLTVEGKPQTKTKLVSSFKKSWTLGEHIDVNNIAAKLENGVLLITLPKLKPIRKTITIAVS